MNIVQEVVDEKKSKGPQRGYLLIQVGEQKFGIPMEQVVDLFF